MRGSVRKRERPMLDLNLGLRRLAVCAAVLAFFGACAPQSLPRGVSGLSAPPEPLGGGRAGAGAREASPAPALSAAEAAEALNAQRPFDAGPIKPMRPFVLKTDAEDRARAQQCLTQAVYYEAANEPLKGQQAVAQVVLNRVRHPAYPKSVCGVVYQGAADATGCQFTFTCDGALHRRTEPALWARAEKVARRALAGYVDREVGSATHYHAVYVAPYWAPSLAKMTQVGQHIFYRWTGPWGEPRAFTGRYAGGEARLDAAVLRSGGQLPEPPPQRQVTLAAADGPRSYRVNDAAAGGGAQGRVAGVLTPSRRQPTPDEIRRINDNLAALSQHLDAKSATEAATPTAANAPS
jgi:hypothetical protein